MVVHDPRDLVGRQPRRGQLTHAAAGHLLAQAPGDVQREPVASGRVAAPDVVASVRQRRLELVQQVAMCAVQLDDVEAQAHGAPLVVVSPFEDVDEAIAAVDRSEFGLQAGIFTRDLPTIQRAFDEIEVGGLVVNDVPTFRIDHMPYGGVKQSGFGREGVRYAIEEMTELKLLALNDRD